MKPKNPLIAKLICLIKGHDWIYPDHIKEGVKTCSNCKLQKKLVK